MIVDTKDLISQQRVARKLEVGSSAISNWRRRHSDFPQPVFKERKVVLYLWPEVKAWAKRTSRWPL